MRTGGSMRRQLLDCDGVIVAIDSSDPTVSDALHAAFVDLSPTSPGAFPGEPHAVLEVHAAPHGFDIGPAGGPYLPFRRPAHVLRAAVRLANRTMLDNDPDRLHLHAGAVSIGGRGLVLSARSGTGKTTTTAALVMAGAAYITDETVAITARPEWIAGAPKPLTIRRGTAALLPKLPLQSVGDWPDPRAPFVVPATRIGSLAAQPPRPFVVAVLHRSDAATDPEIRTLSRADACVALVQETMDFDRYGPQALGAVAALCAASHCVEVVLGDPSDTAAALIQWVALADEPCLAKVASGVTANQTAAHASWIPHPDVRWEWLDDEVVIHHGQTHAIASLRAEGALIWSRVVSNQNGCARNDPTMDFLVEHDFVVRMGSHV